MIKINGNYDYIEFYNNLIIEHNNEINNSIDGMKFLVSCGNNVDAITYNYFDKIKSFEDDLHITDDNKYYYDYIIKKDVDDSKDKIDTIVNNLLDYNEGGRKYMYTENK